MASIQFGVGAYKRDFAGAPEIKLVNRFVEQMPTNTIERSSLLSRSGTNLLVTAAPDVATGKVRKTYSKLGLFNGDLFIVSGGNLYRYPAGGPIVHIAGLIGPGTPKMAWDSGPGYQHLFIADGELLQVYTGGTHAASTLTLTGSITSQIIGIGGTYYGWNSTVDHNSPDGSLAHPWLCKATGDVIQHMADMLSFIGVPGTNFSTNLRGANSLVTATTAGGPPATSMTINAISDGVDGNAITTTVTGPGGVLAWTGATLTGGGTEALEGVYVPTGEPINSVCTLDHFVMASVAGSNKMFYIEPGAVVIAALNFFAKESNPDPILDLLTVGDTFIAAGSGSIETWYATGDLNAPFAPIQGRTVARGIVDGTLVLVQDTPIFVGAEGIVYAVGQGLTRLSNHGIEERIRELLRTTAGVT